MKKVILILLLLLTGCTKKLNCTKTDSYENYEEHQKYSISYEKDIPKKLIFTLTYTSEDSSLLEILKNNMESNIDNLNDNIDSDIIENDNKVTLVLNIDLKDEQNFIDANDEIDKIKEKLESLEFTCK